MIEGGGKLPGEDLVAEGLQDLAQGTISVAALLVLIGAPRLRRLGIAISFKTPVSSSPEHDLYHLLQNENSKTAHSCYNALIRRLVSYERILEKRKSGG